jgi:hypothetical protein
MEENQYDVLIISKMKKKHVFGTLSFYIPYSPEKRITCMVIVVGLELCDVSLEGWNVPLGDAVLSTDLQSIARQDQLLQEKDKNTFPKQQKSPFKPHKVFFLHKNLYFNDSVADHNHGIGTSFWICSHNVVVLSLV